MIINKVVIRTKSIENRNKMLDLVTKGLNRKCSNVAGAYTLDKRFKNRNDMNCIGVFCERVTIYY